MFRNNTEEINQLKEEIEDLKATAERVENFHQRQLAKKEDYIRHLESLKYNHETNLSKEHELNRREADLDERVARMDAREEADEKITDVKAEARKAQLDATEKALADREQHVRAREDAAESKELDKKSADYEAGKSDGYVQGHKEGVASMRPVVTQAHELLKVHALGAHLPQTVKEGEDNPLAEAYGELGASMVDRLITKKDSDEE